MLSDRSGHQMSLRLLTRPQGCCGDALHLLSGHIAGAVMYYWVVWGIRETASDDRYYCGTVQSTTHTKALALARSIYPAYPRFELVQQGAVFQPVCRAA